jgi:hypothetical protein
MRRFGSIRDQRQGNQINTDAAERNAILDSFERRLPTRAWHSGCSRVSPGWWQEEFQEARGRLVAGVSDDAGTMMPSRVATARLRAGG